jgi:hypothetical protein
MQTNARLLNSNFREGTKLMTEKFPKGAIYDSYEDSGLDETAQSQTEIVQKVLVTSHNVFHQHELFFVKKPAHLFRPDYNSSSFTPMDAFTLFRLREEMATERDLKKICSYQPLGFFFNYVAERPQSELVAYSMGGLCDILNIWHIPLVPGMKLFLVAFEGESGTIQIIPFASLFHPLEYKAEPWSKKEVALLDIGILCVGTSRQPLQVTNYPYLVDANNSPCNCVPAGFDATNPIYIQGNVLRVRLAALQWQFFTNK